MKTGNVRLKTNGQGIIKISLEGSFLNQLKFYFLLFLISLALILLI